MRRRTLILGLGGAAAFPLAGRAQAPAIPVIGFLHFASPQTAGDLVAAFRTGLGEAGFFEGKNVAIEFRWAAGQSGRLPDMAAELVRRQIAVIVTLGTSAALAAKAATTTIPIVVSAGGDPVALGLVAALNRPGGNVTGVSFMTAELAAKRLELVRELLPRAARVILLANPTSALTVTLVKDLQAAAPARGLQLEIIYANTDGEIDAAFAALVQKPADALLLAPDPFLTSRRVQLAVLAARYRVPVIYSVREFVEAGGLMSYGPSLAHTYRQVGIYAGRILKGEKPADLPVAQPTKFELVINLKTAKALGVEVPPTLLALADEVIE